MKRVRKRSRRSKIVIWMATNVWSINTMATYTRVEIGTRRGGSKRAARHFLTEAFLSFNRTRLIWLISLAYALHAYAAIRIARNWCRDMTWFPFQQLFGNGVSAMNTLRVETNFSNWHLWFPCIHICLYSFVIFVKFMYLYLRSEKFNFILSTWFLFSHRATSCCSSFRFKQYDSLNTTKFINLLLRLEDFYLIQF